LETGESKTADPDTTKVVSAETLRRFRQTLYIGSATACNNHLVDIKANFLERRNADCGEELLDIPPGDVLWMEAPKVQKTGTVGAAGPPKVLVGGLGTAMEETSTRVAALRNWTSLLLE
jgi:hypothetical protein